MAWACGDASALARGTPRAIISFAAESSTLSWWAAPASGSQYTRRVPEPARDDGRAVDDGGDERARRRLGTVGRVSDRVGDGLVGGGRAAVTRQRRPRADGARPPAPRDQDVPRGARRGEARRRRSPATLDTPSQTTRTAVGPLSRERHRVLVAGLAPAAVADAADQRGRALAPVVALADGRLAAALAVPVVGDGAAAGAADGSRRGLLRDGLRDRGCRVDGAQAGCRTARRTSSRPRRSCRTPQQVTTWSTAGPRWPGRPGRSARRGSRSAPPTPAARASSASRSSGSCAGTPPTWTVVGRALVAARPRAPSPARRPAARPGPRGSMDTVCTLAQRVGQRREVAARRGQELRAHHPGVHVGAARGGDQVERRERAAQVAPRAADAGQPERGRGRVVGVGARADDVERLRDVRLAAQLARGGQRELRRQLARHLPVDGVERGARRDRVAGAQLREARRARRPATPTGRPRGSARSSRSSSVLLARLDRRGRPAQPDLDGLLAAPRPARRCAAAGSLTFTPASQLAAGSLASTLSAGSWSQASGWPASSDVGASNRTDAAECSAGLPGPRSVATTSRSTPSTCARSSSTVGEPVRRVERARLGQQPVERVVRLEHRGVRDRRAATPRRCSCCRGSRAPASPGCGRSCRCRTPRTARPRPPRAPGSRPCRRSPSPGRRSGARRRGR